MNRHLPIALLAFLVLIGIPGRAQEREAPPPDIPALIRQLGDPKVRLRDEAEAKLRLLPAAAAALTEASTNHPSEEARMRARKILNSAIRNRWYLAADLANGHMAGYRFGPQRIRVSNDLKTFLTQGGDCACLWDAASLNPMRRFGKPNGSIWGWEGVAPLSSIAFSPDGRTANTTDDFGVLYATDTATGKLTGSWRCFDMVYDVSELPSRQLVWSVSYTPDGKYLVAGGREGWIVVREAATLKCVKSDKITRETLRDQFYSPDARWLLVIEDTPSDVDYIHVIDTTTWNVVGKTAVGDLVNSLYFFGQGERFIASGRNGYIMIWDFDSETGTIGTQTSWGKYAGGTTGMVLSHDQKSVVVASSTSGKQLCEYDIETKKILWSYINTPQVDTISPFGPDAFITSDWDHHIRVWRRTPAGAANPPPTLVRTLSDRFDTAESFTLKYEADPHDARPCLVDALIHLPNSELLVTRGHDGIRISSATDLSLIRSFGPKVVRFPGYLSRSTSGAIAVTKDEQTVIAADDEGVIGFYNIETGKLERSFPTYTAEVASGLSIGDRATLELVPDHEEKILYTTDNQSRLCSWDMATGKLLAATLLPSPGATVQLSPDGGTLMIRTLDSQQQSRQLLVSTDGLKLRYLAGDNKEACYGLGAYLDDGKIFLRPESDGQLRRFLIDKGRLGAPEVVLRLPATIYQTSLSDDGTRAVCAAAGAVPLSVWDLPEGKLLWMADSASGGLFRAVLLGDDRIVTLGLHDNKLRLYKKNPTTAAPDPE